MTSVSVCIQLLQDAIRMRAVRWLYVPTNGIGQKFFDECFGKLPAAIQQNGLKSLDIVKPLPPGKFT